MESEDWNLGVYDNVLISLTKYRNYTGPAPTVEYKTADTKAGLVGTGYLAYGGAFSSLGWVKVRLST